MSEPKGRVLIVDDEPALRLSLSAVLEADFEVDDASGVLEAKAKLEKAPVDVVLCDYEMPGGNGLDLVRWLKRSKIPVMVILVTGHARRPELRRAEGEAEIVRLLEKPYDPARLLRLVAQTVKLSRFERARQAAMPVPPAGKTL